jgi:hypothetical protein
MKTIVKLVAVLMLLSAPTYFATAKPEDAPGIQKKPLHILNFSVETTATSATVSWETNIPSMGSIFFQNIGILDDKTGTRHSVTIPFLSPDIEYHVRIEAFSEVFGPPITEELTFAL